MEVKMAELLPEVRYTDITEARIEYIFYDGDGPDIILLHAAGLMPWLWHPTAKRIAGSGRITAPYFCNQGKQTLKMEA